MITTAPAGLTDEPLTVFGREIRSADIRHAAERLERGVAEGQVRRGTDCEAWARYIGSVVQGLSGQARDGMPFEALLSTAEIAASTLETLRPRKNA